MRTVRMAGNTLLVCGVLLAALGGMALTGQQAKPPEPSKRPHVAPAPAPIWRSITTGKEYRVWVEHDRMRAEWLNIPPLLAKGGAYIRSELRRAGTKWVGTSQSRLPCVVGDKAAGQFDNWCSVPTRIEINVVTPHSITGRAEGLKRFDCTTCRVLETVWKDFEWLPKH